MKITLTMEGFKALQKTMKNMAGKQVEDVKKETYAAGLDAQREAKNNLKDMGSWDLGNLANTILAEKGDSGLTCEVGPTAGYGPAVEYGTKPHFPPMDALEGWAKRHGFDSAWPICKAISERGLPAKPFLLPAYLVVEEPFFKRLVKILEK